MGDHVMPFRPKNSSIVPNNLQYTADCTIITPALFGILSFDCSQAQERWKHIVKICMILIASAFGLHDHNYLIELR